MDGVWNDLEVEIHRCSGNEIELLAIAGVSFGEMEFGELLMLFGRGLL